MIRFEEKNTFPEPMVFPIRMAFHFNITSQNSPRINIKNDHHRHLSDESDMKSCYILYSINSMSLREKQFAVDIIYIGYQNNIENFASLLCYEQHHQSITLNAVSPSINF